MDYKISYSNESLEDLLQIYDYIANIKNEYLNALRLIDLIRNNIKKLSVVPLRHPIVNFSPWKEIGIRYLLIKNHIIFYYVDEKNFVVNIVRVFSSKRDIENIIK